MDLIKYYHAMGTGLHIPYHAPILHQPSGYEFLKEGQTLGKLSILA